MPETEKAKNKLKLLHLLRIFAAESDKDHPVTVNAVINELSQLGIKAERKSVYSDIAVLKEFGFNIETVRNKEVGYYLSGFPMSYEDAEAFWDLLHAQNFIDESRVNALKRRLEESVSRYEKKKLRKRVYTTDRTIVKSDYFKRTLDIIHEAISEKKKLSFDYISADLLVSGGKKKRKSFTVSPYIVSCISGRFFLIAGSEEIEGLSHFYIDKITNPLITKARATDVREIAGDLDFDLNCYSKGLFEEYSAETESVTLNCERSILDTVSALFNVKGIRLTDDDRYEVIIDTEISEDLLSWLFVNYSAVRIVAPKQLIEAMTNAVKSIYITYI